MSLLDEVVALSNALGDPTEDMAILAEGNASGRTDSESFWIKASGFSLSTLDHSQLVRVDFRPFANLDQELSDLEVRDFLSRSRSEVSELMPSVETFMHAYLLSLPDVNFVGHTHPTPLLTLLALKNAQEIAEKKLFPDDVVCCGPASAFVPYCDPGLPLAKSIKASVNRYIEEWEAVPKTIWLENHGLIATGRTRAEVLNASRMSVKAARIWLGALGSGVEIKALTPDQVSRIHSRPDEHYRQRILAAMEGQPR